MARLGEVLTQRIETVAAQQRFDGFAPITVHLDGRISARNRDKAFKGQMFIARPGDVVFSKIDARHGAIGLLPPSILAATLTPEFPVFTPELGRISGRYLELVLRAGGFIEMIRRRATGTSGRKRITPDIFRRLSIPLPPLTEQNALVATHDRALAEASALEAEAAEIERAAGEAFADALGMASPPPLPDKPMFVARFSELDRWGHEAALRRIAGVGESEAKWPIVRFGDVIADLENGWSPKCLDRPAEGDEWGVLKLSAVTTGRYVDSETKALPGGMSPKEKLEVRHGDVLIIRGSGQTKLVGSACYVSTTRPRLMIPDLVFRLVQLSEPKAQSEFIAEVLKTDALRRQIEDKRTGAAPMMQKITKPALLSLSFPLPPLKTQRALVAALVKTQAKATRLREEAKSKRAAASIAFETSLYG